MVTSSMDTSSVNCSGEMKVDLVRVQRAADAGERRRKRERHGLVAAPGSRPGSAAEISESRIATKARPVGERSRLTSAMQASAVSARHR